jgi:hypothetical protein
LGLGVILGERVDSDAFEFAGDTFVHGLMGTPTHVIGKDETFHIV